MLVVFKNTIKDLNATLYRRDKFPSTGKVGSGRVIKAQPIKMAADIGSCAELQGEITKALNSYSMMTN